MEAAVRISGGRVMAIEVEAVYENGVLKPKQPLPLREQEQVRIIVRPSTSRIRRSAGLIPWSGDQAALDYLLGPENHPWEQ
jgi:predicted DNA-binding antitoxin AbrB/MazE fold protein